ncbi:MAG TPA: hypothetical protein DER39_02400 [Porphyromonadaceae bacterium]|jgi:hypothetical protein|uniref:hypothetical protein n=2 Tax=unclassified Proteiniphilum TaxID=2622718 RepID=UPI000EC194E0|nr:hypothetical protein [Proteiniphilum sp. UBA5463]HCF80536.1 hypothetical protein [Porphyromonadaceae bacterium]
MIIIAMETNHLNMLQDKDIKKIQELKADFTPTRVFVEDIFSRFKALKISEDLSRFKWLKTRGYDFKMVLAILASMVASSDKTVNSYLNSPTGEGTSKGKDLFYSLKNNPFICWRMLMWHFVHRFLKVTSKDRM